MAERGNEPAADQSSSSSNPPASSNALIAAPCALQYLPPARPRKLVTLTLAIEERLRARLRTAFESATPDPPRASVVGYKGFSHRSSLHSICGQERGRR
jgi:hypothetical protein